jgi:excisionase family DNA binding protein
MALEQIQIISTQGALQELIDNSIRSAFEKLDTTSISNQRENEQPITTKQLCEFLGITEPTVIRWRKKGKIPFLQIGSSIRFNLSSVIASLEVSKKKGVKAI